jgi:hypothetical protein
MRKCALVVLLIAITSGCSGQKQATDEEVKSQLTEAVSLASAAELSLERQQAGATPDAFRSADLEYVREQIDDNLKELGKKQPQPDAKAAADQCRDGLTRLQDELSNANSTSDQAGAKSRIHKIRENLERARSSL